MPKRINALVVITGIAMVGLLSLVVSYAMAAEHFSVKEYNEFHEVLHPLQHDALPNKDFKTIRARATELVTLGEAIVKLDVPPGVADSAEFAKELRTFKTALDTFRSDAAGQIAVHTVPPALRGCATTIACSGALAGRFMLQINIRDATFTISVMMKSTRPTSMSA